LHALPGHPDIRYLYIDPPAHHFHADPPLPPDPEPQVPLASCRHCCVRRRELAEEGAYV
jgi:hypothetical protein